jgi:hypothetical protein
MTGGQDRLMDSAPSPADLRTRINRNGIELAAHLLLPPAPAPPAVLFVHGLESSLGSPRNVVIAEALRDAGIAALLFAGENRARLVDKEEAHVAR